MIRTITRFAVPAALLLAVDLDVRTATPDEAALRRPVVVVPVDQSLTQAFCRQHLAGSGQELVALSTGGADRCPCIYPPLFRSRWPKQWRGGGRGFRVYPKVGPSRGLNGA